MTATLGTFYGVGTGPGDPELLTLKAHRILTTAAVICAPKRNYSADGYAYNIIKGYIDPTKQELLELIFPMSKDRTRLMPYWEGNIEQIMERIREGKDCAFITEGDPFLYSTFIYMWELMRDRYPDVPMEVIPGITSINACSALAEFPLANGDERIAVIPATYEVEKLRQVLRDFDTVVLMKVNSVFDQVLTVLEEEGLADSAVYVKKAGAPEQEIVRDIRTLTGRKLEYLSLILVHRTE